MAIPLLDSEFMQYWSKLTVVEKESLLTVAKNYVHAKSDEIVEMDMRKQLIERERKDYMEGKGRSYSWEEVKAMALDKSQRSEL